MNWTKYNISIKLKTREKYGQSFIKTNKQMYNFFLNSRETVLYSERIKEYTNRLRLISLPCVHYYPLPSQANLTYALTLEYFQGDFLTGVGSEDYKS